MKTAGWNISWVLMVVVVVAAQLCGCTTRSTDQVRVACAASMRPMMEELVTGFADTTGVDCSLVHGASGVITAQIIQGAPVDVFASANMNYPEALYKQGFCSEPPSILMQGELVLWSSPGREKFSLNDLANDDVQHIAVANPETAPYGVATMAALRGAGIYKAVEHKLVFGESVEQCNQFILSGAAEVGFTARSSVTTGSAHSVAPWTAVDPALYPSIDHGLVLVLPQKGKPSADAKRFYRFLRSDQCEAVFEKYGYHTPLAYE